MNVIRRICQRAGALLNRAAATKDTEPALPRLGEGPYGFIGFNQHWRRNEPLFTKEIH